MTDSWQDPKFTCNYSQPDDYRFSLDSILLAKAAAHDMNSNKGSKNLRALDLCAGAGVVGFEFSFFYDTIESMDFVEVQEEYRPHFLKNLEASPLREKPAEWIQANYADLLSREPIKKYDLILCNPPYFESWQGKIPPNALKARSRFFLDSDFETLWKFIVSSLTDGGRAYVLLRSLEDHGHTRWLDLQKKSAPLESRLFFIPCAERI